MKITRRVLLAATILALPGTAFAEDQILRFATWNTDPESIAINQAIATKFEEANPGVKVQIELYGDGFDDKLDRGDGGGRRARPDVYVELPGLQGRASAAGRPDRPGRG